MAAPSIWRVSTFANAPESPYDAFLRNPRGKDGKLHLPSRGREFENSDDAVVFNSVWDK